MKISLGEAQEYDIRGLLEERRLAYYTTYKQYGWCPGYTMTERQQLAELRSSRTDVIKITDTYRVIGDISTIETGAGIIIINNLSILPQYQHKGIGQTAIKYVLNKYNKTRIFAVQTPLENERNMRFYTQMGFKQHGVQEMHGIPLAQFKLVRQLEDEVEKATNNN